MVQKRDRQLLRIADLRMYARFVGGLPAFLRQRISMDEAREMVRRRTAAREDAFLALASTAVYSRPASPYLALLRRADCGYGDLVALVRRRGLEGALTELHAAGVSVSFEEFKGRSPIVRRGLELQTRPEDFDNPGVKRGFERESGGTTGRVTRVRVDLDHISATAAHLMILMDAHDLVGLPGALWHGVMPDAIALNELLRGAPMRIVPDRWFTPITYRQARSPWRGRFATYAVLSAGRLFGVPFPWPEYVPMDRARTVARWIADTLRSHRGCFVRTMVSQAVRIAHAAREMQLDLTGTTFGVIGEPPTSAKVRMIRSVGARHAPGYAFAEFGGRVGVGCAQPADENDHHLLMDAAAMIQNPTTVPGTDVTVPAFCITGLLPTGPKILINVSTDDYGILETRSCGCPLEALGLTQHVRAIRSFGKLTGEGVTLVGTDMVRILEEVLPARFGGGPLDYQLAEEEDEHSLTRVTLRISPRVVRRPEHEIIAVLLDSAGPGAAGDMIRALWQKAGTVRVRWCEPVWTSRGKLLPLDLARPLEPFSETATGGPRRAAN